MSQEQAPTPQSDPAREFIDQILEINRKYGSEQQVSHREYERAVNRVAGAFHGGRARAAS